MIINGHDYGYRSASNVDDQRQNWFALSFTQDASTVLQDFGHSQQDITITFNLLTGADKDTLKAYLQGTVKQGGQLVVTPDSGDDLQVGASGPTTFTYLTYKATRKSVNLWLFEIFVRKYL
jgi:hypothetical protein